MKLLEKKVLESVLRLPMKRADVEVFHALIQQRNCQGQRRQHHILSHFAQLQNRRPVHHFLVGRFRELHQLAQHHLRHDVVQGNVGLRGGVVEQEQGQVSAVLMALLNQPVQVVLDEEALDGVHRWECTAFGAVREVKEAEYDSWNGVLVAVLVGGRDDLREIVRLTLGHHVLQFRVGPENVLLPPLAVLQILHLSPE